MVRRRGVPRRCKSFDKRTDAARTLLFSAPRAGSKERNCSAWIIEGEILEALTDLSKAPSISPDDVEEIEELKMNKGCSNVDTIKRKNSRG